MQKERAFLKPMCRKEDDRYILPHTYTKYLLLLKYLDTWKLPKRIVHGSWLWLTVYSWENHSAISPQFPQLGKKGNVLHDLWNSILIPVWDAMYLSRALRLLWEGSYSVASFTLYSNLYSHKSFLLGPPGCWRCESDLQCFSCTFWHLNKCKSDTKKVN